MNALLVRAFLLSFLSTCCKCVRLFPMLNMPYVFLFCTLSTLTYTYVGHLFFFSFSFVRENCLKFSHSSFFPFVFSLKCNHKENDVIHFLCITSLNREAGVMPGIILLLLCLLSSPSIYPLSPLFTLDLPFVFSSLPLLCVCVYPGINRVRLFLK